MTLKMGLARWVFVGAGTFLTGCQLLLTEDWDNFKSSWAGGGGGTPTGSTGSMGGGGAGGQGIGGSAGAAPSCAGGGGGLNDCANKVQDCCDSPAVPYGTAVDCPAINGFFLDAYEVTVGRFKAAIDAGKLMLDPALNDCGGMGTSTWALSMADSNMNRPINCVTWQEAKEFCEKDGGRLPTLGEFRRAAKGGENFVYPWGDATMSPGSMRATFNTTAPRNVGVTTLGQSAFGQFDLAGNVQEWTLSQCDPKAMTPSAQQATFGGSFKSMNNVELEIYATPVSKPPTTRLPETGFRCAREP